METELIYDKRYFDLIRQTSIKNIYEAIVEYITNASDAYLRGDFEKPYVINLSCIAKTETDIYIEITDYATGMSKDDLQKKLLVVGGYTADDTSRGMMGRGAKDPAQIANIDIVTCKDSLCSSVTLRKDKAVINFIETTMTEEMTKKYGNITSHGTYIKISNIQLPIDKLYITSQRLKYNYFIRKIINSEDFQINFYGKNFQYDKEVIGTYKFDPAEAPKTEVIGFTYDVEGYFDKDGNQVKATFHMYKYDKPIRDKFSLGEREYGILVTNGITVYELSGLYHDIPGVRDLLWDRRMRQFYGELDCPYINTILREAASGNTNPQTNPFLALDPSRRHGLAKDHPFVKALFDIPYKTAEMVLRRHNDMTTLQNNLSEFVKDLVKKLNEQLCEFLDSETVLYTWRSKEDHDTIKFKISNVENLTINQQFIGLTYEDFANFKADRQIDVSVKKHKCKIKVQLAANRESDDAFEILFPKSSTIIRINVLFPTIYPFMNVENDDKDISFKHQGKATIAIIDQVMSALSALMTRQKILNGEVNFTSDNLNEISYHESKSKTILANALSPYMQQLTDKSNIQTLEKEGETTQLTL